MRKIYIVTAILAFLIALISQLPARTAWQWWADDAASQGLFLNHIEGRLVNGQAATLSTDTVQISDLEWQASYLPLLIGRIQADILGNIDRYPLSATVSASVGGTVTVSDADAALPMALVAPIAKLPIMPLDGLLNINLGSLQMEAQRVISAEGKASIRAAQWKLMRPKLALGNLTADISTVEDVIIADLSSDGPLEVKGQCRLNPDNSYEADIQLRSASGADNRLDNLLKTLGRPVEGWYRIKTKGQVPGS